MKSNSFSLSRAFLLIRNDIVLNRSIITTVTITLAVLLLLANMIAPHNILSVNTSPSGYFWVLFVGGIWITSKIFRELHSKERSYFSLTLPCSNFERFFVAFFETAILYPIAALLLYTLFYWIIGLVSWLIFKSFYFVITPIQLTTWSMIGVYIIIQSWFLLGAIYFRSHAFIKTVLTLALVGLCFGIVVLVLARIFLGEFYFLGSMWPLHYTNAMPEFFNIAKNIFWIGLAPVCWIVAYFRVKEVEAR
ncbi:MAG: hypothetical protein KAS93_02795 [Gammaproteobacteria bacterium]|nr:hypothetical protein [Gammaproteobacteria bacterium]